MGRVYTKHTGLTESLEDLLYDSKRVIMDTSMASELNVLAEMLNRISESNRRSRDFTLNSLRDTIVEVVASFPVYRTYITSSGWTPTIARCSRSAIDGARRRNPAMDATIFDFFREVLLPRDPEIAGSVQPRHERREGYPPADATEARRAPPVRHEVPAVHRAAPGERAGGHRVLSLQPAAVAQRGRRGSVAIRRVVDGVPRAEPPPACATGRTR